MAGGQTISMSETRAEALTLQSSAYGVTKTVVHGTTRIAGNLADYLDFKAIAHVDRQTAGKGGGVTTESTSYTYSVTMVMNLCEGRTDGVPIDVKAVWRGKTIYRTKDGQSPLAQVGASLLGGALGQSVWSPLNTLANGTHAIGYSGMACIAAQDYDLGGSAQIENHLFEVAAGGRLNLTAGTTLDADPAVVIQDWLTNDVWGLAIDSSMMGSMAQYSAYCRAAGLLMSPALSEQANASDRIKDMCDLTNAWPVMMDNAVHIVPLGDETLTGNDATYTPDIEPVAHLTADVCKKIRPRRKAPADAYNIVKVEFKSRDNDYNVAVVDAKDLASIEQFGARTAPTIQAHWICDKATADKVAQIALKRFRYILNSYEAYVPWNFAYLVPSSICTLTDPDEGLDAAWVRIKTIEEDDGGYKLEMEEFPHAVSSVSTGTLPSLGGYKHDYNVEPGAIAVPQFFEAPVELTTTGLEVLVAVAGTGQNWGGCQVWVSNDGTGYQQVATIYGGSRYGTLSSQLAAAPAGTLAVQLAGRGGQIISGSALDAERLATLCWVKGTANGSKAEYLAFEQATMVSTNEYTMTGLVRGAYGTSQSAKPAGSRFVRIDETIGRSGPLQPDMIGQTLHFKFASFNVYGGAPQQLDECDEYTYTITGEMMRLPPATVTSITAAARVFGIDLSLVIPQQAANLKTTQVWSSHTNDRATATKLVDLAYPASTHSITGLSSGEQMYFWARLIDGYDNIGEWYPASATGGVPGAASSDASQILAYLSGKISTTELAQSLRDEVALISAPSSTTGSVAQRVNDEAVARAAAIAAEAAARANGITSEATTRANADTALSNTITTLTSTVNGNTAAITSEASTRANADTALSNSLTALTSTVSGNTAAITSEATTRANADTALSNSLTALTSTVSGNTAAITSEATTRANADTALSNSITTLTSTVSGNTAAITTEATTRASETTGLKAQYSVKVNVNGKVAGYGLSSTANNATPTSEFSVLADRFSISSGSDANYPFVIEGGNTYINKAFIGTGWIENAMIGNVIQSTSFTDGSDGWEINKAGSIKAYNVTLRGGLDVGSTGYVRGGQTSYNTGTGFWGGYHGGVYKFSMGNPSGNYLTYDGTNMVLKGKFTADSIDAVDTLNIKGDAVFVPATGAFYRPINYGSPLGQQQDEVLVTFTPVNIERQAKAIFFVSFLVDSNFNGDSGIESYIQLMRGSTLVWQIRAQSFPANSEGNYPAGAYVPFIRVQDIVPIGTHIYTLRLHKVLTNGNHNINTLTQASIDLTITMLIGK